MRSYNGTLPSFLKTETNHTLHFTVITYFWSYDTKLLWNIRNAFRKWRRVSFCVVNHFICQWQCSIHSVSIFTILSWNYCIFNIYWNFIMIDNQLLYYLFLIFLKFYFCYLFVSSCTGSSLLLGVFSSCSKWGLLSSCSVQASHWGYFSCCEA